MKSFRSIGQSCLVVLLMLGVAVVLTSCGRAERRAALRDTINQVGVVGSLDSGYFDGQITCSNLLHYGDFGLGTFEALDGEMVVLDGQVYRVNAEGVAAQVGPDTLTPFAAITFFDPDLTFDIADVDAPQFKKAMDWKMPSDRLAYAIRVTGEFSYIKTRSEPAVEKPYPSLAVALEGETEFEFHDVAGTMVGFRYPDYLQPMYGAGYHFHFLTTDRTKGGHVLNFKLSQGRVELDTSYTLKVLLPTNPVPATAQSP